MALLERVPQLEDEYSLLSEMEMLHVYGGSGGDIIISNHGYCEVNTTTGCGSSSGGTGSGSGSGTGSGSGSGSGNGSGSGSGSGNSEHASGNGNNNDGNNIAIFACVSK